MKKKIRRILIFCFLLLISTLFMPFSFGRGHASKEYYSVMRDAGIPLSTKVTDIAMLGAHDAFSSGIKYSSKANSNEDGIITNKLAGAFAKGLIVRLSKSQRESAKGLLRCGVRYLDVRATKIGDTYYASHGYLSDELGKYIKETAQFLEDNPGEFVIFDIQHFYTENGCNYYIPDSDYQDLFSYIGSEKNEEGHSLLDFLHYDAQAVSLKDLTYCMVTDDGKKGGIIFLAKCEDTSYSYYRDSDASYDRDVYFSVRSLWHKTSSTRKLLQGISEEFAYLKANKQEGVFVINQAQKTGFMASVGILGGMLEWSLLDMASRSNRKMTSDEQRFKDWLSVMPIFMVDNAASSNGNFSNLANKYIKEYNQGL